MARAASWGVWLPILAVAGAVALPARAQERTRYRIIEGSLLILTNEDGTGWTEPLHGTFDLYPTTPPAQYVVEHFRGFDSIGTECVTGSGSYMFNYGNHNLVLDVLIDGAPHHLDSGWPPFEAFPPMVRIDLSEPSSPGQPVYSIRLIAVPALGVWFSTRIGFHTPNLTYISHGDVLTQFGSVLWSNQALTQNLGIQPPVPDLGCDAIVPIEIDYLHDWQCLFSTDVGAWSEIHGWISDGDFLSEGGFIMHRNFEMVQNFLPNPPIDVGLDAITFGYVCNDWYFSSEIDFWSDHMGTLVRHGDVLCKRDGWIYKTNEDLLAKFNPVGPHPYPGLDALYLWPTGQIWFSVNEGFVDANYGSISDGDLLSTDGWVIYRNLQLVRRFEPIEDTNNFGLDGLHLVPVMPGDMNGDERVNAFDIDPFVMALADREAYYQLYPELDPDVVGDINYDGYLNAFDIDPFVALLINQP